MRSRLQYKSKPNSFTESFAANEAGRWRERMCEYPERSQVDFQIKGGLFFKINQAHFPIY
jgi:hypothetical protein